MSSERNESPFSQLRERAEKIIMERFGPNSDEEAELIHELRTHQIELEIQNQDLREAQLGLQVALQEYRELYDFAPVGFFTLNSEGEIKQANLTATTLLEVDRGDLPGKKLARFVIDEDQDAYFLEVLRHLEDEGQHESELRVRTGDGGHFWALFTLSVEADEDGDGYSTWCTLTNIDRRKGVEAVLEDSRNRLRELAGRLQEVRENERTILARDLHDEFGQDLVALSLDLSWMGKDLRPDQVELRKLVGGMRELIAGLIGRLNEKLVELRPPELDILGLGATIEHVLKTLADKGRISVLSEINVDRLPLDADHRIQVLRIFEQAVANVLRHAQAQEIRVSLTMVGDDLVLEVEDDGVGITEEQVRSGASFGLIGMRERALPLGGQIEVGPAESGGTKLRAVFPIGEAPPL